MAAAALPREQPSTRPPVALVHLISRDGLLYWEIRRCPRCGNRHRHGGGYEVPPLGSRVAHCHGGYSTSEYELVPELGAWVPR